VGEFQARLPGNGYRPADASPCHTFDADHSGETQLRFSKPPHDDLTQKMADFTADYLPKIGDLSGFIVCAKSPSCGMERVRLYDENGNRGRKEGVGLFTAALLETWPWLPGRRWSAARPGAAGKLYRACFCPARAEHAA
jgi:uncharacterized protein YbbK (DUF523 family)